MPRSSESVAALASALAKAQAELINPDLRPLLASDSQGVVVGMPRLIDERVPGVTAVIDDVVEGFENSVR
jgi:hypothetical protein